jgi:DNA-directed RNA polymerase specialized sigma24 family protein
MNPEKLYRTGISYREAFEIAEGQTSSGGEGGGGGSGPKAPQPRLIQAGEDLADMRKGLNPRQRKVLDMVCGLDMRVREAATAMRAGVPATERALRGGLAMAAASLAAQRQKREDDGAESMVIRVRGAHGMIARARG